MVFKFKLDALLMDENTDPQFLPVVLSPEDRSAISMMMNLGDLLRTLVKELQNLQDQAGTEVKKIQQMQATKELNNPAKGDEILFKEKYRPE